MTLHLFSNMDLYLGFWSSLTLSVGILASIMSDSCFADFLLKSLVGKLCLYKYHERLLRLQYTEYAVFVLDPQSWWL